MDRRTCPDRDEVFPIRPECRGPPHRDLRPPVAIKVVNYEWSIVARPHGCLRQVEMRQSLVPSSRLGIDVGVAGVPLSELSLALDGFPFQHHLVFAVAVDVAQLVSFGL